MNNMNCQLQKILHSYMTFDQINRDLEKNYIFSLIPGNYLKNIKIKTITGKNGKLKKYLT